MPSASPHRSRSHPLISPILTPSSIQSPPHSPSISHPSLPPFPLSPLSNSHPILHPIPSPLSIHFSPPPSSNSHPTSIHFSPLPTSIHFSPLPTSIHFSPPTSIQSTPHLHPILTPTLIQFSPSPSSNSHPLPHPILTLSPIQFSPSPPSTFLPSNSLFSISTNLQTFTPMHLQCGPNREASKTAEIRAFWCSAIRLGRSEHEDTARALRYVERGERERV